MNGGSGKHFLGSGKLRDMNKDLDVEFNPIYFAYSPIVLKLNVNLG